MSIGPSEWAEWLSGGYTDLSETAKRVLRALDAEDPGDEYGTAIDFLREAVSDADNMLGDFTVWEETES